MFRETVKNKYHPLSFFQRVFHWNKKDLWPIISKHLSNSTLSPVLVFHQCLIFRRLAALPLTFPAYVTSSCQYWSLSICMPDISKQSKSVHLALIPITWETWQVVVVVKVTKYCRVSPAQAELLDHLHAFVPMLLFSPSCLSVNSELDLWHHSLEGVTWRVTSCIQL